MWCLPHKHIVLFDTETTDLALAKAVGVVPEIVEIAAVKLDQFLNVVDSFEMLVQPLVIDNITSYSTGVNNITVEMLLDAPLWSDCWRKFAEFTAFNALPLMSYGIAFDMPVLRSSYARARVGFPHSIHAFDVPSFVYARSCRTGMDVTSWSLDSMCRLFGIERGIKHRAMPDVKDTLSLLKAMSEIDD